MTGLGTLINAAAIIAGGIGGLIVGKTLKQRYQELIMIALGLSTMFISIAGTLSKMLVIRGETITTQGTYMMIASLVIGALMGEWINIEMRMEQFGEWLKKKTNNSKDIVFVDGFVTTSLTVCIGAMAVIGSINDGIYHDPTILITKAILDAALVLILTTSMGKGCIFSAIPVVFFQGSITICARLIQPILTDAALSNLSLVGNILIFCVGVNLVFGKRIRVGNLLPAIALAVVCALF